MCFLCAARPSGTGDAELISCPFPFSAFVYLLAVFWYVRCDGGDTGGSVLVETLLVVGLGGGGGGGGGGGAAAAWVATSAYVRSGGGGGGSWRDHVCVVVVAFGCLRLGMVFVCACIPLASPLPSRSIPRLSLWFP